MLVSTRRSRRQLPALGMLVAAVMCAKGAPSATTTVRAGDDLQAALDRARPGDTVLLEAGAIFVGNFVLRAKSGDQFVTIRSSAEDSSLPREGTRVSPTDASRLPKLVTNNANAALQVDVGAHHYRLQYIEFVAAADGNTDTLINLGYGDQTQSSVDAAPHDLILAHILINVPSGTPLKRGVGLHSRKTTIVDSHIAGIKKVGQETQAIAGWNGPGEFLIENNFIEASGINVLLGGADPSIPDLVPSDIVFRRNHFTKRWSWWAQHPTYEGTRWTVKNLFELKNAQRVTIVGNVFENNWIEAQSGWAIGYTPRSGGRAPWSTIRDIVFTHNVVAHSPNGINILGWSEYEPAQQARNITISNNLFYDLDSKYGADSGRFLQILGGPANVTVEHNTVDHTGNVITFDGTPMSGLVYRNNLSKHNSYGIVGSGVGSGETALKHFAPGYVFSGNVVAGGSAVLHPSGNHFPAVDVFNGSFVERMLGNYRLAPTSPFRAAATDGSDVGANMDTLDFEQGRASPAVAHSVVRPSTTDSAARR